MPFSHSPIWHLLWIIFGMWWWKAACAAWAAVATYDLALSQVIPLRWADEFPRVRDVIDGGWLPLWAWLLVLAAIIVAASLEYAYRRTPTALLSGGGVAEAGNLRSIKEFRLWEAACLAGHVPAAKPVPAGPAFIEYERMREEFFAGRLNFVMPQKNRESVRQMEMIRRNRPGIDFSHVPPQLTDEARISRVEFSNYLKSRGIAVQGITD